MADPITDYVGSMGLDPNSPFTIGGGYGYLPFVQSQDQLLSSLYLGQGGLGNNLLDTLAKLREDPNSGPAGLAAYQQYGGGAQNIAAGTGGKGIANPYETIFDRLLKGLSGSVMNPGSPFNPDNNGQFNPSAAKIDPNNAPAPNPQAAAEAPNNAQALIDAYKAYHGGQGPAGIPGAIGGQKFYGFDTAQKAMDFARQIQGATPAQLEALRQIAAERALHPQASPAPGPVPVGTPGPDGTIVPPSAPGPEIPVNTSPMFPILPPGWHAPTPTPGYADGGVVLKGQPHWIVTGSGTPVAEVTEDGKPEHVGGFGGIEVTPLDPQRRAAYEASKQGGQVLGDMENEVRRQSPPVKAATGVKALFPQIPNSQVNTEAGAPSGSNMLPTAGGTDVSRADQVAATSPFKGGVDASGNPIIPDGANDIERYSKMLGGALSAGNTAVNVDALRSLNAGKLPNQLLSSTELGSMLPSQQLDYLNLLSQAGLGSVNDLKAQIKRFAPVALK